MQLEEELGVKLFHRSNHNIVLTEEGMLLKQRAQDIVALADRAKLPCVRPQDLENQSLIMANSTFARSLLGTWLGDAQKRVQIVATGNLLYNMAVLANSGLGAVLGIRLNCTYNDLCFRPLEPSLETGTVLAWRKEQLFSPAGDAFIDFAKTYIKRISEDAI